MSLIRAGVAEDLPEIRAIQAASPEAAQWDPADYLGYHLLVCVGDGRVTGFAVYHDVAPGERELLNLAVAPPFRRRAVGRRLVEALLKSSQTGQALTVFLEVRESNRAARAFYNSLGFQEVSLRENYYDFPPESAIVLKFHSC